MQHVLKALEDMEAACADPEALMNHKLPELESILKEISQVPEALRPELMERLTRIQAVMEAQMLLYEEEVAQLRVQIREAQRNTKASGAYNRVAVLQVPKPAAGTEQG